MLTPHFFTPLPLEAKHNMGYKTPLRSVHIFPDRKTSYIPVIIRNFREVAKNG